MTPTSCILGVLIEKLLRGKSDQDVAPKVPTSAPPAPSKQRTKGSRAGKRASNSRRGEQTSSEEELQADSPLAQAMAQAVKFLEKQDIPVVGSPKMAPRARRLKPRSSKAKTQNSTIFSTSPTTTESATTTSRRDISQNLPRARPPGAGPIPRDMSLEELRVGGRAL